MENTNINDDGVFEWEHVNVTVKTKDQICGKFSDKQILHDISGKIEKGQLLGIMGSSGAGKSTFLNALSGRVISTPNMSIDGLISVNKHKYKIGKSSAIKYISAYVLQHDILSPALTVKESLTFGAQLSSQECKSKSDFEAKADTVIQSLHLDKVSNTLIGNESIKGISGGEKKRVSVGMELITNPDIIYLDEPTSGLDSYTSYTTIKLLKEFASENKKQVIMTIHQPSTEIFKMIDVVMLLAQGHVVYFGHVNDCLKYFEYPLDSDMNPADYIVEEIQTNELKYIEKWKDNIYKNNIDSHTKTLAITVPKRAPVPSQIHALLNRELKLLLRDPRVTKIRIIQTILFALVVGLLYLDVGDDSHSKRNKWGAVFFTLINSGMTGLFTMVTTFPEVRVLFEKERNNNMYSTIVYLLVIIFKALIENILFSLLYVIIVYFMIGLDQNFWGYYLVVTINMAAMTAVGICAGCFAANATEAMQYINLPMIIFLLFSNFFVSADQIPSVLSWIKYINTWYYGLNALAIAEFEGIVWSANDTGNMYLDELDVAHGGNKWIENVVLILVCYIGYISIACVVLALRNGM